MTAPALLTLARTACLGASTVTAAREALSLRRATVRATERAAPAGGTSADAFGAYAVAITVVRTPPMLAPNAHPPVVARAQAACDAHTMAAAAERAGRRLARGAAPTLVAVAAAGAAFPAAVTVCRASVLLAGLASPAGRAQTFAMHALSPPEERMAAKGGASGHMTWARVDGA